MKRFPTPLFWLLLLLAARAHAADMEETRIGPGLPEEWKLTGSAAPAARLLPSSQKVLGVFPLELKYAFRKGQNDFVFMEKPVPLPGKPKKAKVMVYGDGSGNSLRANFADASGETFQAVIAKLAWDGWKEIETDLAFPTHWGGDDNGQLDGEVAFHSLVLNTEPDNKKQEGAVAFSRLSVFSEKPAAAGAVELGRSVRVTIDDFERANPLTVYQTWRGDDSTIEAVSSAEYKKEGNYSMQVTYKLSTTRQVPSWVSLSFTPERAMDWSQAEELKFWVRGDGTRNILQLTLLDEEKRAWTVKVQETLKNVEWHLVEIPVARLKDGQGQRVWTPGRVIRYEFAVVGEEAQLSSGRIWLDEFAVFGRDLDPLAVAPRPPVSQDVIDKTKINFGDFMHLEYRQTPELSSQFLFYNSLFIRGTMKKLSLSADLVSEQTEAGTSIGFRSPQEQSSGQKQSPTEVVEKRPPVQLAVINATLHDLHPNLSQVSVGNLSIDYGRDVFSPVFGFKGVSAEGNVQPLHYDAFAIKHAFDSATLGYRFQANFQETLLKHQMVHHRDTVKSIANAQVSDGSLSTPSNLNLKTEPVGRDTVFFFEADRNFLANRLNFALNYGMDFFEREGVKDVTDPFNPVLQRRLESPVSLYGRLWLVRGKVLPGLVNRGLTFIASYRHMSSEFKPRFRFNPSYYDDFIADQRGFRFELTQIIGRFKFNGQYDDVDRGPSSSGYFRRFFQGSVGYYGWNRFDVVFSVNKRREFYALGENHLRSTFFINPADPRNEEGDSYEIFLGNWFLSNFYVWTKLRYETIKLYNRGTKVRNDAFQAQGEYGVTANAKLVLSVTQTRYDDKNGEPFGGDPPTDNVVRLYLDVNF